MPGKGSKGGKNRRRGKNESSTDKRELVFKEEGEGEPPSAPNNRHPAPDYAQVLKMLGNGRLEAFCFEDGIKRLCHIRGKMRKKVWINTGDVVLVSLREYQDERGDVIYK